MTDGSTSDTVQRRREGRLTIVTINRPAAMNALRREEQQALATIFDEFDADPDQWIAILTGAGDRAFCAGHDLKQEANGGDRGIAASGFAGLSRRFDRAKPVIAAVNGICLGGGFEAALACDIIVASDNARFGLPEPRIGFAALSGGITRLVRAIGDKRALEILLTARHVPADEARQLGFVSHVTPAGGALRLAREIADTILLASPLSIRATIAAARLDRGGLRETMEAAWSLPAVTAMRASADFHEGPRAFAEKRAPRWSGR